MVDYFPLRSNNHTLPEPEPEEEEAAPEPILVDCVYNIYEERNGKTIALKLSIQLPVKSLGYPHSQ
jgi:hypothetical protein